MAVPDQEWLKKHGDDLVSVKVADLVCAVGRLLELKAGGLGSPMATMRLFTCDLPRLLGYLPPEAAAILNAGCGQPGAE